MNDDEILKAFLQEQKSIYYFCLKYKINKQYLINLLKENGYLYACNKTSFKLIVNLKLAAEKYLSDTRLYIDEVAKEFNINNKTLSKYLKQYLNIKIETRHKSKFNDTFFDLINTEEKAYWLGFIFADGYISYNNDINKKKYEFELSLNIKDINHLEKLANVFCVNIIKDYERCRLIVRSRHMWEVLNSYGCTPRKSLTLKFPDIKIFYNKELIRHFIRGYFDGDGCVSLVKNKIQISMIGTENFLTNSVMLFQNFVGQLNLYHAKRHNKKTFYIHTSCNKALKILSYLYDDSHIYLERKYEKYIAHLNGDI